MPATPSPSAPDDVPVFTDLTPGHILDALDGVGLRGDGRILQLNSYENRVFQLHLDDTTVVVAKFYRPRRWTDAQILEEHAFSAEAASDEIPVVAPLRLARLARLEAGRDDGATELLGDPPTLARSPVAFGGYRFSVTPRRAGRAPELEDPETLRWIGRFLGRLHAVGARRPFLHRTTLTLDGTARAARDWLLEHDRIPPEALAVWRDACQQAIEEAARLFDAVGPVETIRLHGDCHPGNLLWTPTGPHFVDLDDACNGPAVQDLWMLLPGDAANAAAPLAALLEGYTAFRDFDRRELRLIEPLRTLRMLHHSAWIARRWQDPAFPIAFPWFEGSTYWQQQAQQLREQVDAMRDA